MNVHHLEGCAPTPLANYLKALGILRLVSEQVDVDARGWWDGEQFLLASKLDTGALLEFFLTRYCPTALVSPWNKGSGFYGKDSALDAAQSSTARRFGKLREGVRAGRELLSAISSADQSVREIKGETKIKGYPKAQREALRRDEFYKHRLAEAERNFKRLKTGLVPQLKLAWRGSHREWMDAALVLEDDEKVRFPALLGTGGNDGNLDFTNNYFQRLNEIFDLSEEQGAPRDDAREWFEEAMFGQPARVLREDLAVGQFAPGGAGGANSTNAPSGTSRVNPVDFVLMLEGIVSFTAAVTRRADTRRSGRAVAPFAIGGRAAGYASASESDESPRGEQWMPLWSQPATYSELKHMLAEGRAQLGSRSATEPLDLARSVARLGTARGIVAFQRYGYIERNGQSNLAIPLGRLVVADRSLPALACLDDLDVWLPRLRREARSKGAPTRLALVERRLADALFAVTAHPDEPVRWQSVLLRLADVEGVQVSGSGHRAGPIPRLRPEWVTAADDASPEFRLALACSLQQAGFKPADFALEGVRRHWLPLDGSRYSVTGAGSQSRMRMSPDQVLHGRSGIDDAIAIVNRRLIEAGQRGQRRLPLVPAYRASALPVDLASFLAGEVDADRTLHLSRALMALDARAWRRKPRPPRSTTRREMPDDAWIAIRLAMLPWALPDGREIGTDPAILRRLANGDPATAERIARGRLRAAGIATTVRAATVSPDVARRWAAALAFPISKATAASFAQRVDPHSSMKEAAE